MEERLSSLEQKFNELQTLANTPKKVVVSPNIPISLFVNGPSGDDACFLPQGRVTQIVLNLIGPKDATVVLNFLQGVNNTSEEIALKLGQVTLERIIQVPFITIVRAKLVTEDLTARLVIGFNFQPSASYVAEKGVDNAGAIT